MAMMLAVLMFLHVYGAVSSVVQGSYDPPLHYFFNALDVKNSTIPIPVDGVLSTPPSPYTFHMSTFMDPNADKDFAYMTSVCPLCLAFNFPNRRNQYYTLYPEAVADLLNGNPTSLYTTDVFPTLAFNMTSWTIALPNNGTATAKALLDSLSMAVPTFKRPSEAQYPTMKPNVYNVSYFQTERDLANYVLNTSFSIGIMSNAMAKEYLLPCLRLRMRQVRQSDLIVSPRVAPDSITKYTMDTTTFATGMQRSNAVIYPFVGPIVVHVSPQYVCTSAEDTPLEDFLYDILLDKQVTYALATFSGARLRPMALNNVLAKAQQRLCVHGSLINTATTDILSHVTVALTSMKFVDRSTMVKINQGGTTNNIEGVISGKYNFAISNLVPTEMQYNRLPSLRVLPLFSTAISVVFNIGETDVSVDISRCLLPLIFNGTILWWNDTAIQQDNPFLILPKSRIRVWAYNNSAVNWVITQALQDIDKQCYGGVERFRVSTQWPFQPWSNLFFAKDEEDARSNVMSTQNTIAFVQSSVAQEWEMTALNIWDPSTKNVLNAIDDLSNSVAKALVSPNTSELELDRARSDIYPFVSITYAVYDADVRAANCANQHTITNFFDYILEDDDAYMAALKYGYFVIPYEIRSVVQARFHAEAMCNGEHLYPQPDTTESTLLRDAVISVVAVIIGCVSIVLFTRWYRRRAQVLYAPKSNTKKFTTMMIALKKESQLWETYPAGMPIVTRRINEVLSTCVSRSRCYRVKEIGSATMLTANTSADCVALAKDLVQSMAEASLNALLGEPVEEIGSVSDTPNSRRRLSRQSSGRDNTLTQPSTKSSFTSLRSGKELPSIAFGIGIHQDVGRISYNELLHSYDYSGPCTDTAAVITDAAQGHQILISSGSIENTFQEDCSEAPFTTLYVASREVNVHQYNPPERPVLTFEQPTEDSNIDSIAATLQQKSSGLATKRILAMSLCITSVDTKKPPEEVARAYKQQVDVLGEAVARSKGYMHGFFGGRAFISFNAVYPTPQACKRAYLCVDAVRTGLGENSSKVSCGMQYDTAMVGPFQMILSAEMGHGHHGGGGGRGGKKSSGGPPTHEHHGVISKAVEQAIGMHSLGIVHYKDDAVIIPSTLDDEFSTFAEIEYLDFIKPVGSNNIVGMVSVRQMKQVTEMDEWMYELEEKNTVGGGENGSHGDPIQFVNQIFRKLLSDMSEESFAVIRDLWNRVVSEGKNTSVLTTTGGKVLQGVFGSFSSVPEYLNGIKISI